MSQRGGGGKSDIFAEGASPSRIFSTYSIRIFHSNPLTLGPARPTVLEEPYPKLLDGPRWLSHNTRAKAKRRTVSTRGRTICR